MVENLSNISITLCFTGNGADDDSFLELQTINLQTYICSRILRLVHGHYSFRLHDVKGAFHPPSVRLKQRVNNEAAPQFAPLKCVSHQEFTLHIVDCGSQITYP